MTLWTEVEALSPVLDVFVNKSLETATDVVIVEAGGRRENTGVSMGLAVPRFPPPQTTLGATSGWFEGGLVSFEVGAPAWL